jgi:DNA-binding PadR family transcriptional regulator
VTQPYGDPGKGIGLAARVILHLSSLQRLGPNDLARLEYTQQGMVATFDVLQGSLVRVLQRLRAGDVVTVERRFVAGANRRMKVYRLTALGEAAAQDLRHPKVDRPAPSADETSWVAEITPPGRSDRDVDRLGA